MNNYLNNVQYATYSLYGLYNMEFPFLSLDFGMWPK